MEKKSILSKIWGKLKSLKNTILSKAPGAGYKKREALREWDRTIRYYSVRLLDDAENEVNDMLRKVWLDKRNEKLREIVDSYRAQLHSSREKIKNASHGYMPSWTPGGGKIAVKEEKLRKVIDIDERIMHLCEELKTRTRKFNDLVSMEAVAEEQVQSIAVDFRSKLRDVTDLFDERYKVLYEVLGAQEGA